MALPLGTWATNANYPAGTDDWSGQPTKVAHPGPSGGFVPGQGSAAQYFNELFNKLFAQDIAIAALVGSLETVVCTSDQTLVAPENAVGALLIGYGGGGGAGRGPTSTGADEYTSGGGGGGGAVELIAYVPVVGGESYAVDIGAGGAGGVSGDTSGKPGADTTFTRVTGSVLLAKFSGADGGYAGHAVLGAGRYIWSMGGNPVRATGGSTVLCYTLNASSPADNTWTNTITTLPEEPTPHLHLAPQTGGAGRSAIDSTSGKTGYPSPQGYTGGTGGSPGGAGSGTNRGGGGGGGGGAGPGGNGGAAGKGGDGNSGAGVAGTSASANTGAGGGGGGAGAGPAGVGADGGAGGSGKLTVIWILKTV